jgi:Acetyl xylan esterase (AXE1)
MKITECFSNYEKLLHEKAIQLPCRDFSVDNTKKEVVSLVKKSLGIDDKWIPEFNVKVVKTIEKSSFKVQLLRAESWTGVSAAANLYVPENASAENKRPLIIICCGHGKGGKLNTAYQTMAAMFATQGSVVLVADNIGQGERTPMGHHDCPMVFACGLSVQGLIVMETIGWLRWVSKLPFVDSSRIGATGNSGGGTLTLFLCALFPDLSAACPTGYPCTFDFIARKEKRHCDCNIIPDCLGSYEMRDVLGCFAPKPLLISQGVHDNLFPEDIFYSTARKIKDIYIQTGAKDNFDAVSLPGTHSWDSDRQNLIARFFQKVFELAPPDDILNSDLLTEDDLIFRSWAEEALTTEQLACALTENKYPVDCKFEDIFKPRFEPENTQVNHFRSVDAWRVFAQFEAFMS